MLRELFVNLAIMLSLLFIGQQCVKSDDINAASPIRKRMVLGVVYGVIGTALVGFYVWKIELFYIDLRHIPVMLAALYGGWVPALIAALIIGMIEYLFTGFDSGVFLVFLQLIVTALVCGLFSNLRQPDRIKYGIMIMYVYIQNVTIFAILTNEMLILKQVILAYGLAFTTGSIFAFKFMQYLLRTDRKLRLLQASRQELLDTIREHQGYIFKFRKKNKRYHHTLYGGQLPNCIGIAPEEVINQNAVAVVKEGRSQKAVFCYEEAWKGKEVTYELTYPDREKTCLVMLRPIQKQGRVVEVVGSVVDITDKKAAQKELKASEAKYRLITENTLDLIALWDKSGKVTYVSPSHNACLGYDSEYLQGQLKTEIFHPDDVKSIVGQVKKLIATREPFTLEYRVRHAEGYWLTLEATTMPVLNEEKEVTNFVVIARDVTERKQAEERLRFTEKLLAVGELAAGVAHEIRNPLTTLKGFVQFMREGHRDDTYFTLMESELERIELITNEFLLLAKPQAYELKPLKVDVLMENVTALLVAQANLFGIELKMKFERDLPIVMCEENLLKQVFVNLIKNAIEAMPDGGEIVIEVKRSGDESIRILVHDQGCGIEAERISKLGEPFYSLKEKGTGLGLMVCFKIIKEHHGSIHFSSEVGKGTTVEIVLPIRK
ncbi:Sporulation kinase E [compost metagenome]